MDIHGIEDRAMTRQWVVGGGTTGFTDREGDTGDGRQCFVAKGRGRARNRQIHR